MELTSEQAKKQELFRLKESIQISIDKNGKCILDKLNAKHIGIDPDKINDLQVWANALDSMFGEFAVGVVPGPEDFQITIKKIK